ncbi:hypothetical protein ZL58_14200 [Salmonella enterica subsp. enterica serovar Typhimurium]|nr:hypothetical protein [Salmonella enterica subsp. enterica serovar Typhimurium]
MADEKDDVSVEGSAARAADRGRDQLGFGESDGKPSLGDPSVVAELVADFCEAVIGVRTRYLNDEFDGAKAKFYIRQIAFEYGRIVMGQDERFQPLAWHSPKNLGARIKKVIQPVPGIDDPGNALFFTLASSLSSLSVALGEGRMSDADAKQHLIDLQKQANDLILGW